MATEDPLHRLQLLQRDLLAFSEANLTDLRRIAAQVDASHKDLLALLHRRKKNEASRSELVRNMHKPQDAQPDTIMLDAVEYEVHYPFREIALEVSDYLDLDELQAAKLCIEAVPVDQSADDFSQFHRARLRYHVQRCSLLECLRLLLSLGIDSDLEDDDIKACFQDVVRIMVQGETAGQNDSSAYWRKCLDGLLDIETYHKRLGERKQMLVMTGQILTAEEAETLYHERRLLTQQHESLAAAMCLLIQGNYAQPEDFRLVFSRAAALEADMELTMHYMPILISGAIQFAPEHATDVNAAHGLYSLLAAGAGQLQWKQPSFRAMATICWLAEYSSRFTGAYGDAPAGNTDESRSQLFFEALKDKGLHFMLSTAAYVQPVIWHDSALSATIGFLTPTVENVPRASETFALLTRRILQSFPEALLTNMPDMLRKLKVEGDKKRRNLMPSDLTKAHEAPLALERFMVITALAYEGDANAARDFWSDRESQWHGFLRWVSQRLPTPRVAAFCHLLRSIACDADTADHAHRFLLADVTMASGRLRKAYAVSWTQILSELQHYSSYFQERPVIAQSMTDDGHDEPETGIMLDAYLGLAAHICRTSPEARLWLLKDPPFNLGDMLFQLARSGTLPRVRACCLDMLSALLTDKTFETRNGMWVLLDGWVVNGGFEGSHALRPQVNKQQYPAKQYLHFFANNAEAGNALVGLLNALVTPPQGPGDATLGSLPFPEGLGAPHRHAGINTYVDFVLDSLFARKIDQMGLEGEHDLIDMLRFNCLQFAYICLINFNEDLVLLANTTSVAVEAAIETKSLATYTRVHPFARVMEWLSNKRVVEALVATLQQSADLLDESDTDSPVVQATLRAVQVLNVAWRLQSTYVDLIRPGIASQSSRAAPVPGSTSGLIDDVFLNHIDAVVYIAKCMTCRHAELSLQCTELLQRIGASRKLADTAATGPGRQNNRVVNILSQTVPTVGLELSQYFMGFDWDLELGRDSERLVKARAVLDLINTGLQASGTRPGIAHFLLGFVCGERKVEVPPNSAFAHSQSLFHQIASCAAEFPNGLGNNNLPWLLAVQRGCLDVLSKLLESSLTTFHVRRELREMEFQSALALKQVPALAVPLWDGRLIQDPTLLFEPSALAVCDFLQIRKAFFEIFANDLRNAAEQGSYSVQEKIVGALLGNVRAASGEHRPAATMLELFDFLELETQATFEAQCTFLGDVDLSGCTKPGSDEALVEYDVKMAVELLTLRKREMRDKRMLPEGAELLCDDEIRALVASLTSWNRWNAIQAARLDTLETWADLFSLVITKGGLSQTDVATLSLRGLLAVLPKFEKALSDNMNAAALLAKLTLTLTHAIAPASNNELQQTDDVATERLLAIYRVSLKAITDSNTDLTLRDVCYRINCAVLAALPQLGTTGAGRPRPSANSRQLLQLVQNSGERLFTVVTEDVFSGRGITRISALLFLDGLTAQFHASRATPLLLRALMTLNFVPVLVDTTIGNVANAFEGADETALTLAYFHSALTLLLRLCQSTEGTQLVLNSDFFETVAESKLFSTDPDIGLDIDNPASLKEFYRILAAILRVVTAVVLSKGTPQGTSFLRENRWSMTAVFKRSSTDKAAEVKEVAAEFSRLITATRFLDDDAPVRDSRMSGFT